MKSMAEFAKLKVEAIKSMEERNKNYKIIIDVAMSTCGITAGAKEVFEEIKKVLEEKGIKDVSVRQTGCPGLCFCEPLVIISGGNEKSRFYGKINPEKVKRLIEEDVILDKPVKEWLINIER